MVSKIAILTSGGDAPGLNAAIRAVVRTAIYNGVKVVGVQRGFEGMIDGDFVQLETRSVGNIIQRGGTILKSSRSEKFKTAEGRKEAYRQLKTTGADGLIIIGGDGTFTGARVFLSEYQIPCIGIPKTIDNDLFGTDYTIGYDTAVNTAMYAIDKIRDTAESHNRLFLVEVMGRDAGFIALRTGIAVGAEAILVPETKTDINHLFCVLETGWDRKKDSMIIVVAEGDEDGGANSIASKLKTRFPDFDIRVSILGHVQRGGSPSCFDRVLASKLGSAAVDALLKGMNNLMVGEIKGEITFTPFEKAVKHHAEVNPQMHHLLQILSS